MVKMSSFLFLEKFLDPFFKMFNSTEATHRNQKSTDRWDVRKITPNSNTTYKENTQDFNIFWNSIQIKNDRAEPAGDQNQADI